MIVYDIQHLVKRYPNQPHPANQDITLQIEQGEIFGLLGDNGAGKSTLVRQMVNLVRPSSGRITLFGRDIAADPYLVPLHVGYMPQDARALNNLSVGEALFFTAHLRGVSRADARRDRDALLALWQIEDLRNAFTPQISDGQKRLVQLAVAMAGSPPVLILDEPTNDLDPQRRKMVWDVLRQVNAERGTTIIFITHDAIEAEKIIQRVGILRAGELAAVGRPSELKKIVDRNLRLELFFPPEMPPRLPAGLTCYQRDAGRWLVLLDWSQMSALFACLDLNQIDDFRLYSATLEDLYLYYAQQSQTTALSSSIS
jgi:ABC-2 type transport system ATP-binding protein